MAVTRGPIILACCLFAALKGVLAEPLPLDFAALDYPFNTTHADALPSMQQSLQLSKGFYQLSHHQFQHWFAGRSPLASRYAVLAFDYVSNWLPLGNGWVHEEWHRAVLTNRDIASYDEVYDWKLFSELIAVSHVEDADLIRLKAQHPPDLVRLAEAGMEAQYELNLELEKDAFFYNAQTWNGVLLWENYLNSSFYLDTCASSASNQISNAENGVTDVSRRDFTGLDCDAWVYDLFRPGEPYTARGTHPSGIGVDRYRSASDLTTEELAYLKRQRNLSLLNYLDPFLYGFNGFSAINPFNHRPMRWSATARHHLTSFGYTVDANLFLHQEGDNALLVIHNYFNHERYFPGLELSLLRHHLGFFGRPATATARLALWMQPQGQGFYSRNGAPGALLGGRLGYRLSGRVEPFIEVEAKTAGWVAGNVFLDANVSTRVGMTVLAF